MGTIAYDDANIVYSPYCWSDESTFMKTILAGSYVRALIETDAGDAPSDLFLTFDLTGTTQPQASVIDYRVNRGAWVRAIVNSTSIEVEIPSETEYWIRTEVEFLYSAHSGGTDWWTTEVNAIQFTGFSSTDTIQTAAVQTRPYTLLCIGDSLSYGGLALAAYDDIPASTSAPFSASNTRLGWAYPLAEALNAEAGFDCWGGTGVTNDSGAGNVPKAITTWDQLWDGEARVFTSPPDVIVINHGTNDAAATDGDMTTAVTALLDDILTTLAAVEVVWLRPWNGTKAAAIIAGIAACEDPDRVTYVNTEGWFDTDQASDGIHPFGYENVTNLVPRIAAAVGGVLHAEASVFTNVSGTAVPGWLFT